MALKDLCTEEIADQGIEIEIYHPGNGEPLGIVVGMLGSDSQVYVDADKKIRNRNLELGKRKRDFTVGMDPDTVEANAVEKMTACFLFWKEKTADGSYKNTVEFEPGKELPSTKGEFKKIIERRGFFWFRQQVQEGMDKTSNFLRKPAPPSAPQPPSASATTPPAPTEAV